MRVLKVADVAMTASGGLSGAMRANGEALARRGHQVTFLWRHQLVSDRCPTRLRRVVVPWVVCLRVARQMMSADVVEIHEPLAGPYAWLSSVGVCRRYLPPCVVLSHGLEDRCWRTFLESKVLVGTPVTRRSRFWMRTAFLPQTWLGLRRAAQVIVLNQADRRHLERSGIPDDRVNVVANGVRTEDFKSVHEPGSFLRVLFLGTWIERKGVKDLAEAWALVSQSHPSAQLTLAGTGAASTTVLCGFASRCRSSLRVIPHLEHDQVPSLFAAHDVAVLPSWFEGMPLAALEAAASGLAVLATAIPGTSDIFPRGEDDGAILVETQDPAALAASIGRLADDPQLLVTLQGRARKTAKKFTWESSAAGFERAYRMALEGAAPRARLTNPNTV